MWSKTGVTPPTACAGKPMPRTPSNLASMKGIRGSSVTSPNVCVTVIPPTCGRKDQRRPSPLPIPGQGLFWASTRGALGMQMVQGIAIWGKTISSIPTHISPNLHLGRQWSPERTGVAQGLERAETEMATLPSRNRRDTRRAHTPAQWPSFHLSRTGS